MAYLEGTLTGAGNFCARVHEIFTTDTVVTTEGSEWNVVWGIPPDGTDDNLTEIVYQGLSMEGSPVFLGVRYEATSTGNIGRIGFVGMQGINSSATQLSEHVNTSPMEYFTFPLGDTSIDYYISICPRRFTGHVRFGSFSGSWYAGLLLPFTNLNEYPLPFFVGAMHRYSTANYNSSSWNSNIDFWILTLGNCYYLSPQFTWGQLYTADGGDSNPITASQSRDAVWPIKDSGRGPLYDYIADETGFEYSFATSTKAGDYTLQGGSFNGFSQNFINDFGVLLEKTFIIKYYSNNDSRALGGFEGWSGIFGQASSYSTVTDQDTEEHIVVPTFGYPQVRLALEKV